MKKKVWYKEYLFPIILAVLFVGTFIHGFITQRTPEATANLMFYITLVLAAWLIGKYAIKKKN